MINNVQSLKDKAKNFAVDNKLNVQVVLQNFMFERFLEGFAEVSEKIGQLKMMAKDGKKN